MFEMIQDKQESRRHTKQQLTKYNERMKDRKKTKKQKKRCSRGRDVQVLKIKNCKVNKQV